MNLAQVVRLFVHPFTTQDLRIEPLSFFSDFLNEKKSRRVRKAQK